MAVADRPVPQNMAALAKANVVRLARAELKREIGQATPGPDQVRLVVRCIHRPPVYAETMTVFDLLGAMHRWGRTRSRRLLLSLNLPETKTLGALTDRQRFRLARKLEGDDPGPDVLYAALPWGS